MEEDSAPTGPTSPRSSSSSLPGRVVRLHFCCKAELPLGSSLRVTGSTLWAPTHLHASDPTNAHHLAHNLEQSTATVASTVGVAPDAALLEQYYTGQEDMSYASSVEMVTSPDLYPLWFTRRPVVVTLHKKATPASLQHHYYRYIVTTPGANTSINLAAAEGDDENDDMQAEPTGVTTSNDFTESSAVFAWEDPFHYNLPDATPLQSTASMKSVVSGQHTTQRRTNLANLPYRTLDINVEQAGVVYTRQEDTQVVSSLDGTTSIRVDTWNASDDASFSPYLIREAINQENAKLNESKQQLAQLQASSNDNNMMDTESGGGHRTPPAFPKEQRIFFVCYHLPVVVVQDATTKEWRASWSESLLAKTEGSSVTDTYNAHWVGTVTTHPPIVSEQDKQAVTAVLREMDCTPLFLNAELLTSAYFGFCKQVLWPAFHNVDLLDLSGNNKPQDNRGWDQSKLDKWWGAYQQVNDSFAQSMASMVRLNDIVWIHDYHLSLLPQLLSQHETSHCGTTMSRKVFFLHIPFPTSQIFRELECGEALLQGILHADVVGFHAFDHARHFLNASKRILGLDYESLVGGLIGVHFQGKTVLVTMSNVSIEPKMIDAALLLPTVEAGRNELKQKHGDRMMIGCVDIGQRLSGVSLKLLAFERLLQDYPSWQTRVVMVQRVLLPGSRPADETSSVRELRVLVKRISDTFGSQVIDYQEMQGTSMPMDQRLALWKASDVMMVTAIREGLNHWPMEFIYAHKEPERPGVVIASEFSAVCSILNGALRVNPYDIQMSVTTIDKALSMDMQEREGRRYRDIDFVSTSPSDRWTRNVLRDLRDAIIHQPVVDSQSNSASHTPGTNTPLGRKELIDSTAAYLARESGLAFSHLDVLSMREAFDASTNRVLILDFNGTIVIKEPPGKYLKREILGTSGNKPPPEVIEALTTLCADPRNTVYVVSGDSSENVVNAVGHIPGLGLAASNGGHFSPPTEPGQTQRTWQTFDLGVDWDAVKRVALPVLSKYTARSNGSFVKLTHFSIGWSYYSCDPEWGSMQASHLVLELENELNAFDVRFVTLKGVVEIVPRKLNKGLLVKKVLRDTAVRNGGVDFIMCMGDDISDEKMFTSVFSFVAEIGDDQTVKPTPPVVGAEDTGMDVETAVQVQGRDPMFCYTVAVGKKPTHASQWVHDAAEVADVLVAMTRQESRGSSYRQTSSDNIFS